MESIDAGGLKCRLPKKCQILVTAIKLFAILVDVDRIWLLGSFRHILERY